eukprot:COSAG05_NODE_23792_length_255_cov_1.307692_1_plen_27_part_01
MLRYAAAADIVLVRLPPPLLLTIGRLP